MTFIDLICICCEEEVYKTGEIKEQTYFPMDSQSGENGPLETVLVWNIEGAMKHFGKWTRYFTVLLLPIAISSCFG